MRTFTSADEAKWFGKGRRLYHRVRIADPSGALVDYTVDGGAAVDWVTSWRVRASVDEPVVGATILLHREVDGTSLAPYLAPGSEAIKAGREVEILVAATAIGDPTPSDWWPLFHGYTDGWSTDGIDGGTIEVVCRDDMGRLADTWTIQENTYGSAGGVPVENVVQSIINERFSDITTYAVDNLDWGIREYTQSMQSILDAAMEALGGPGALFRYRWNNTYSAFRFEMFLPDRSATTPVYTWEYGDYFDLPSFEESSDDIRNEGIIKWTGGTVTAEDATSQAEYGRIKTIVLNAETDGQIDTVGRATTFITNVVADLSQPLAQKQVSSPLFPAVMVNDLYRFGANPAFHTNDLDMAVSAYEHRYGPDGAGTIMDLRGQPSGGVTRWDSVRDRLEEVTPTAPAPTDDPSLTADDIEFYYTVASGSAGGGFSDPGDADGSLGGYASTTAVSAAINGLFRGVSETERVAGITLYRAVAVINTQTSEAFYDWESVIAYLDDSASDGVTWSIGFDPQGVHTAAALYSAIAADEETAPAGVTFSAPQSVDGSPAAVGGETIPGGSGRIIHIRMEVSASSVATITDDNLILVDQVPLSGLSS